MVDIPRDKYSGSHFFSPGSFFTSATPYHKWERMRLKHLEEEAPDRSLIVFQRQPHLQKTGCLSYSYRNVDIRRCPLLRSSKLLVLDGAGYGMNEMSRDDENLSPSTTDIPLASNFGQTYLAIMYGLPLMSKLNLIKTLPEGQRPQVPAVTFYLPNGMTLSRAELAAICAVHEIADEVLGCRGTSGRMMVLSNDIRDQVDAYVTNGPIVRSMLALLNKELVIRKKRLSNNQVAQSISDIKRFSSAIASALRNARVNARNVRPLPSLRVLLNTDRCHQTNQHCVEDCRWNVTGV